jgi:hypothetical protein
MMVEHLENEHFNLHTRRCVVQEDVSLNVEAADELKIL